MTQIKFIGFDVHKETIAVAVVDEERISADRFYGMMPNTPDAVRRLFDRLSGLGIKLHFCYEAGGCGYGLYRQMTQLAASCTVVAPSKMPSRVTGSRTIVVMQLPWRGCYAPANLRECGCRTSIMRPCATWCAPVGRQRPTSIGRTAA